MGFVKDNFFAPRVTHYEKTVMCWLADNYQDETGYANPSVAHLAVWGIMSERQVQRCLRSLESKKIIVPLPDAAGSRRSTRYGFAGLPTTNARGDHQSPRRGDCQSPQGVTNGRGGVTVDTGRGDQACHPNKNRTVEQNSTEPKAPGNGNGWRLRENWPAPPVRDGVKLQETLTDRVVAISKGGMWTDPALVSLGSATDQVGG